MVLGANVLEWAERGDELVASADDMGLMLIVSTAARIQALASMRLLTGRPSAPLLMDAKRAAQHLGPSFSAKWLYNHWRELPQDCIRRVGKRVLFVGDRLTVWACDSGRTVPRSK